MKLRGTDGRLNRDLEPSVTRIWTMNEPKTDPAAQTSLQENSRATNTLLALVL